MIHKNRCNRRWIRRIKMKRKLNILTYHAHNDFLEWALSHPRYLGQLNKGKVHSSVTWDTQKSTRLRRNNNTRWSNSWQSCNKRKLYCIRDRKQFDRLEYMEDYYEI